MQHIEKKKDKTDSDLQEAVIVRTKRNLLDDVKKNPSNCTSFFSYIQFCLRKKVTHFQKS